MASCATTISPTGNADHIVHGGVAPITSTVRGLSNVVLAGPSNRLNHETVISFDTIISVPIDAVGDTIALQFDDHEPAPARAISDACELDISWLRAWAGEACSARLSTGAK